MSATIEGEKKMKNRSIFPAVIFILLLSIALAGTASAEYAFNDPEVPQESKNAASLVFRALSIWFESLGSLEQNDVSKANQIRRKTVVALDDALREYEKVRKQIPKGSIDERGIPVHIRRDLAKLDIPFPTDKKQLADIAIQQIQLLKKSVESMDYSRPPSENRKQIRIMIGNIWQVVVLGLDTAEIAASVK